ncbi:MAG: tail fiber domain-containing protein [Pseudomonas sp.]|uniref:tail fiber domain-containing protein n=1 Tax=Pseudomonas sp. TaxID=306 RepID=UPI003BB777AC
MKNSKAGQYMKKSRKWTQRGASLIEMAMALSLMAVMISSVAWYASDSRSQVTLRNDAQHFAVLAQAATNYIETNRTALIASASSRTVSMADLQSDGFLASGVATRLGAKRQQDVTLLIRFILGSVGAPSTVQGLLVSHDGQPYRDSELGNMVQTIGAMAGFMRDQPGSPAWLTEIAGNNRGWVSFLSDWSGAAFPVAVRPTTGHLMALVTMKRMENSVVGASDDWLHSENTGNPALNEMEADFSINGDVDIAGDIALYNNCVINVSFLFSPPLPPTYPGGPSPIYPMCGTSIPGGTLRINNDNGINGEVGAFTSRGNVEINNLLMNGNSIDSVALTVGTATADGVDAHQIDYTYHINTSDRSLKSDIKKIDSGINKISQMAGYEFTWRKTGKQDVGVIAQEVENVFPNLVKSSPEGILAVNYSGLIAPLIEAAKDLQQMIGSTKKSFGIWENQQYRQQSEINLLKEKLRSRKLDIIKLKYLINQSLTIEERVLCAAHCE